MFATINASIKSAAKSTGAFINNNKGKIALTVAGIGAAVYFRDEIADAVNTAFHTVTEVTPVAAEVVEATVVSVS